ncbi:hypothetical protein PIB30_068220, partial [Stylosanthes scabra]|nr:hypothetical protein [Stylosanthes scabra]
MESVVMECMRQFGREQYEAFNVARKANLSFDDFNVRHNPLILSASSLKPSSSMEVGLEAGQPPGKPPDRLANQSQNKSIKNAAKDCSFDFAPVQSR